VTPILLCRVTEIPSNNANFVVQCDRNFLKKLPICHLKTIETVFDKTSLCGRGHSGQCQLVRIKTNFPLGLYPTQSH